MNNKDAKEFDTKSIGFILGGAVVGAIAGYVIHKIGYKSILETLKTNKIIPPVFGNIINEFTSKKKSDN